MAAKGPNWERNRQTKERQAAARRRAWASTNPGDTPASVMRRTLKRQAQRERAAARGPLAVPRLPGLDEHPQGPLSPLRHAAARIGPPLSSGGLQRQGNKGQGKDRWQGQEGDERAANGSANHPCCGDPSEQLILCVGHGDRKRAGHSPAPRIGPMEEAATTAGGRGGGLPPTGGQAPSGLLPQSAYVPPGGLSRPHSHRDQDQRHLAGLQRRAKSQAVAHVSRSSSSSSGSCYGRTAPRRSQGQRLMSLSPPEEVTSDMKPGHFAEPPVLPREVASGQAKERQAADRRRAWASTNPGDTPALVMRKPLKRQARRERAAARKAEGPTHIDSESESPTSSVSTLSISDPESIDRRPAIDKQIAHDSPEALPEQDGRPAGVQQPRRKPKERRRRIEVPLCGRTALSCDRRVCDP